MMYSHITSFSELIRSPNLNRFNWFTTCTKDLGGNPGGAGDSNTGIPPSKSVWNQCCSMVLQNIASDESVFWMKYKIEDTCDY